MFRVQRRASLLEETRTPTAPGNGAPLLEVRDLRTYFKVDQALVKCVDGVSFTVREGETLGIVGESGSGKSVTCQTIMGLNPPGATVTQGEVLLRGENLLGVSESRLRGVRGNEIAMVFQDPMTTLNPVRKIGYHLVEAIRLHQSVGRRQAKRRAVELLKAVGIPQPAQRIDDYPHQFSGGMRQRVMIAIALANDPALLIADEPTTALDVTMQAQILALMKRLQSEFGSAIILVTHDLGVVAEIADSVVVMYGGRVVESAAVGTLFDEPRHPYTWGLLGSLPRIDVDVERLVQIPGAPPSPARPPTGCRFHPRCPYRMEICSAVEPVLAPADTRPDHLQACHLNEETKRAEASRLAAAFKAGGQ